jgi:hypothetical protein
VSEKKSDEETRWWKEDADRINALALAAKKAGIVVRVSDKLPKGAKQKETRDDSR